VFEDPLSLALIAIAAVLIIFMFVSSRRRKRDSETMRQKIVPGAEVMTRQGIFGTLLSVDEETNEAIIETTPGTRLRVHSQTIAKVVEAIEPVANEADDEPRALLNESSVEPITDPEFGERDEKPKPRPRKKPTE
jgi:preprotein translocase subunit YajC